MAGARYSGLPTGVPETGKAPPNQALPATATPAENPSKQPQVKWINQEQSIYQVTMPNGYIVTSMSERLDVIHIKSPGKELSNESLTLNYHQDKGQWSYVYQSPSGQKHTGSDPIPTELAPATAPFLRNAYDAVYAAQGTHRPGFRELGAFAADTQSKAHALHRVVNQAQRSPQALQKQPAQTAQSQQPSQSNRFRPSLS